MNQKGFTLIELIISTFIFSLIMVAILNFFIFGVKTQMYSFSSNNMLNQVNYAVEYIGRYTRMAKKNNSLSPKCEGIETGKYFNVNDDSLTFIDYKNECHSFFLENGQVRERRQGEKDLPLTSSKFNVKNLKFEVKGDEVSDNYQPRITILLEVEESAKKVNAPSVKIQTTITNRAIDYNFY
ncbi:MAG TPA: prepilin-type N-terminal cleavage/methylation domain-containing protein [Candidatus Pacearchaeota archaeon]|nr:prepilin-type N-terminal cleavage/methylation domain-containing protein [Candidatus Pacearchaeota archaeon]